MMGTPLGLSGLSPQNSNGRKATWAMCPPEILRQLVSGCSMIWESCGWRWQFISITCHPFFANLYCILLVKDPGFPALEISLISQTEEVLDMRLYWPGETGCKFALNEACSRPQLGRTWCCPCFAQVAYGETQAYICTVRVWVRECLRLMNHASGEPVKMVNSGLSTWVPAHVRTVPCQSLACFLRNNYYMK